MANESIYEMINRTVEEAVDLLFPVKCPFCGRVIRRDKTCPVCEKELPRCNKLLTGAGFGRASAPLWYEGAARNAVLDYKFYGHMGGTRAFGALMAECAAEHYSGEFDTITWVPVSKKRLKKRGFDQARFLAASLCAEWDAVPVETLCKVVDNPAQSTMADHSARKANVLGVYEAVNKECIAGKRILLVDDIFTTGATLSEAARVLKDAGAADVMCLTLAMTPEHA